MSIYGKYWMSNVNKVKPFFPERISGNFCKCDCCSSALLWSATCSPRGQKLQVLGFGGVGCCQEIALLASPAGRKQYFSPNWAHCSPNKNTRAGQHHNTILPPSSTFKEGWNNKKLDSFFTCSCSQKQYKRHSREICNCCCCLFHSLLLHLLGQLQDIRLQNVLYSQKYGGYAHACPWQASLCER